MNDLVVVVRKRKKIFDFDSCPAVLLILLIRVLLAASCVLLSS
jgi:hypothetical protein